MQNSEIIKILLLVVFQQKGSRTIFNGTFTGDAYQNDLSVRYNHDYNVDGTPAAQRGRFQIMESCHRTQRNYISRLPFQHFLQLIQPTMQHL